MTYALKNRVNSKKSQALSEAPNHSTVILSEAHFIGAESLP
jgi:hypothetical protein